MSFPPNALRSRIRNIKRKGIDFYKSLGLGIAHRSPYDNIFHCCVQKTASQWFKAVFCDEIFYQNTGLSAESYSKVGLRQDIYGSVPSRKVATPLYISYPDYLKLPKPETYKTFFVTRDPRDIVVSFYFSTKYSHPLMAYIPKMRKELEEMTVPEGLKYAADALEEMGVFEAQKSWAAMEDANCKIFQYEDLARDNRTFLHELLSYLEVDIAPEQFDVLYERHAFKNLTKGRVQGKEDINSHYRKGSAGDWKEHFDEDVMTYFQNVTGDLVDRLAYADS